MIASGSSRRTFLPVAGAVLTFLILPSILMAFSSFSAGEMIVFPPEGLSLRWYEALLGDRGMRQAFVNTTTVAAVCTLLATFAGTLAAIALARYRIVFRSSIEVYLLLPFTIPVAVSAIGFLNIYGYTGIIGRTWTIGVALCAINLPFMIGAVSSAASRLDGHLEEAAASCGARPIERFLTVTIPSVAPGIMAGALLMFITAYNEYVVAAFLVDVRSMVLSVHTFNEGRGVTTPMIAAISVFYMAVAVITVWLLDRLVGIETFLKAAR